MGRSVASQQVDALASDGMRAESVIDRTPDELLLKIFDFYRLGSPRPYKTGWVWEWPLLAQVCRRWHGLVLSSPNRLKTMDFHFTHGAPVADILPRLSPTSALSIDYWDEAYDDDEELILWSEEDIDGVLLALEQSDRITDVRLFGTTETLESIFESMTQPAPKLQSLKVQAAIDDPSPVFPFNFLGGSASALRNLELTGIIPPLPSTPCLTRLEVNLEDFHADLFALHEFVGHICAMPQLETLILSVSAVLLDEDEDAEDQITPNGAPATLSALSTISLRGLGAHLEALVCRILAPQLEVLEVQFTDHSDMTAIPSLANFIRSSTKLHAPGMAHLGLSGDGGFIKTYPSPEDRQRSPLSFSFRYMEP
ncbi:hypothetical protein BC834DRAFT_668108 [Gloeopeniophorella convolvens]|nr:hypothetical protein BC834DRAFT_668108 [Gloeopeniophorella convolvens]